MTDLISSSGVVAPAAWDPLHAASPAGCLWTRANIGEALPGVATPLTWSIWEVGAEIAGRGGFYALGAATRAESMVPADRDQRFTRAFYGRGAVRVEFLATMGDRIPGTSGAAIAEQLLGNAPAEPLSRPTRRRYPVIAVRMPLTFMRVPQQLRRAAADTKIWWLRNSASAANLTETDALALFIQARERFNNNTRLQGTALFCVVQPIYDALDHLTTSTGVGDLTSLTSGYGSVPEAAVVGDLWRASRGEIDLEDVVARHGYHGPREGELSAKSWREDNGPIQRFLAEYAAMDESQDPLVREAQLATQRREMEKAILTALPATHRPLVRTLFRMAEQRIPLRGIAKDAFLMSLDVLRASARRIGELLAARGVLADPEDVFFLTDDEIIAATPADVQDLIARRRERYNYYLGVQLPSRWAGAPVPIDLSVSDGESDVITGVGVSPGVVEGYARVVIDPDFDEVEPGEILVAASTDPSWASIMFISSALVVDIGGALSHAAIVARELGIPCVVNTGTGSRRIRTGDRCRVDGKTGTITILQHASNEQETS
jgi:phosphohistidine swiveling domain-containing protein